jgi:hypothetical protein
MSTQTTPSQDTPIMTTMSSQANYYPVGATDLWPWPKGFFDNTADELTERNYKQSLLLRLPIDIRLIIYEYVLASGSRISMNGAVTTKAISEKKTPGPTWSGRYSESEEHAHRHTQNPHHYRHSPWSPLHLSSNARRNGATHVRQTELLRWQVWRCSLPGP